MDPALIQTIQGYAAETHHGNEHVDRWNRVLAAFGTNVQHVNPMTAQEAQTYVDKGWNRWIPVTAALVEIEKAATQPQQTDPEPQPTEETDPQVAQTVIDKVTDWRDEQAAGTTHYERWDRVLAAFGTVDRTDAMTAQEAQTYVDKGWNRWVQIVDILEDIEAAAQQQQQQQQGTALENPQYAQQQDQLPSTQQDQQLSPSAEWAIVKAEANSVDFEIVIIVNDILNGPDSEIRQKVDQLYRKYLTSSNSLRGLVYDGDNLDPQDLPSHIIKTRAAIEWVKNEIIAPMNKAIDPYGPVESCPPDLRDNKANRNFLNAVNGKIIDTYDNGTVVKTSGNGAVLIEFGDGTYAEREDDGTVSLNGNTVYRSGFALKLTVSDFVDRYVDATIIKTEVEGKFRNSLEDRVCAYHDIDYYGEDHNNLIKSAMLALGIHPEADNITPMSADKAYELENKYDNSRYGFTGDFMYPVWQESIWKEIATEIQQRESDNYYEENKDRIESSHMTQTEMCAQPLTFCEYDAIKHGDGYIETWISKVISFKSIDSILENLDSTYSSTNKITEVDGSKTTTKYYIDGKVILQKERFQDGVNNFKTYYLHSGQIAMPVNLGSSVESFSVYHTNTTGHDKRIASAHTVKNDVVHDGSVFYSDTGRSIIDRVSGTDTCYNKARDTIDCTDEHKALLNFDKYIKPGVIAQEATYGRDGIPTEIILYDYSGVPIQKHMIERE